LIALSIALSLSKDTLLQLLCASLNHSHASLWSNDDRQMAKACEHAQVGLGVQLAGWVAFEFVTRALNGTGSIVTPEWHRVAFELHRRGRVRKRCTCMAQRG
jgi:hypothetical protein